MTSRPTILCKILAGPNLRNMKLQYLIDKNDSLYSEEQKKEIKKKNILRGVHIYPLTDQIICINTKIYI